MHRLALALALGAIDTAQLILRAIDFGLDPLRLEMARDLKQRTRATREADRLTTSVVRDIERL